MTAADVATITGAVDFSTILTGVAAIGAALVVVYVGTKGVKMLLSALGR